MNKKYLQSPILLTIAVGAVIGMAGCSQKVPPAPEHYSTPDQTANQTQQYMQQMEQANPNMPAAEKAALQGAVDRDRGGVAGPQINITSHSKSAGGK